MLEKKREINTYTKSLNAYLRPKTIKENIATEKKKHKIWMWITIKLYFIPKTKNKTSR